MEMETPGNDPPCPAPLTLAFNLITKAAESHPAPIQCLSLSIFHKFSTLKNKEPQQLLTLSHLAKDTFLPCSAWLAFKLQASPKVMETEDFTTLATSMAELTLKWKTEAKDAILKVAELESKALHSEIITCMAFLALKLGKLFLLKRDPTADLAHATALVHYTFKKCGNPLFEHISSINSAATMVDCCSFLSKLPQILQITGSISPSAIQKVIFNLFLNDYTALLKTLFIESWTSQTKAHKELASERAMVKELKTILDGSATQQAAMAIDTEPTVDPKILRDLIKTQIQTETKKIHSELNKLSQKVTCQGMTAKPTTPSSKNSPWGAN